MLRFQNQDYVSGKVVEFEISMSSVQEGVLIEVNQFEDDHLIQSENVTLTPMNAARFVSEIKYNDGMLYSPIIGNNSRAISTGIITGDYVNWRFVGDVNAYLVLRIGSIAMLVPRFVIEAMIIAIDNMMVGLMHPSTGSLE